MNALPDAARHVVEAAMIEGYKYQSEFARKYFTQGLEEGREQGREQGREEGLGVAVVELARQKLGALSAEDEGRLAAVKDPAERTRLVLAFGRARDAAEARAIIDALA